MLERLTPEERAAFILHDAFDCDYDTIAATLEKSEPACRKLVSRARERVRREHPRQSVSGDQHRALLARFAEATATRNADALARLFAPDIVFYSDGGGRVPAALNPIFGADKVQRLILGLTRKTAALNGATLTPVEINGRPGLVVMLADSVYSALDIETDGERINAVYLVRNPDKLTRVGRAFRRSYANGSSASV